MTNNPLLMSLVGVAWALPQVLLGPFSGVVVDRLSKRWVMMGSDLFRFALTGGMTILAFTHILLPAEIIGAAFLSNAAAALFMPAAGALTPLMVSENQLSVANGLEQASGPFSMIVGPALSAALIAWLGVPASFGVNVLTYLLSVGTLLMIRVTEPVKEKKPWDFQNFRGELLEGLAAIRGIPLLAVLIPIGLLLNFLFGPMDLYLVQFVTTVLHQSQVALGEINSTLALGMMAGAVVTGLLLKRFRPGYVLTGGLVLSNAAMISLPLVAWLPGDLVGAFIAGVGIMLTNVTLFTVMQRMIAKSVMGRVFGLLGTLFGGAMPLGMLFGGFLASVLSVRLLIGGVGAIGLLLGFSCLLLPVVRTTRFGVAEPESMTQSA